MEGGLFCAGGGVEGFGVGVGEGVSFFLSLGGGVCGGVFFGGGRGGWMGLMGSRSLVYIEGEASMNKFTAKDGSAQQSLSIVQRECPGVGGWGGFY